MRTADEHCYIKVKYIVKNSSYYHKGLSDAKCKNFTYSEEKPSVLESIVMDSIVNMSEGESSTAVTGGIIFLGVWIISSACACSLLTSFCCCFLAFKLKKKGAVVHDQKHLGDGAEGPRKRKSKTRRRPSRRGRSCSSSATSSEDEKPAMGQPVMSHDQQIIVMPALQTEAGAYESS